MDIGYSASLISPQRWDQSFPQAGQFKRVLASSFLLHLVFFTLLLTIQVTPTLNESPPAYQVALISMSDLTATSQQPQPFTKSTGEKEALPPSVSPAPTKSFQPNPEKLSETFAGAVGTIAVPQERMVNRVIPQTQPLAMSGQALQIPTDSQLSPTPPPSLPNLEVAQSTAHPSSDPLPLPQEGSFSKALKNVVQSVKIPDPQNRESEAIPPTAVAKSPPLSSRAREPIPAPNQKGVAESLREVMKSVVVPESRRETVQKELNESVVSKKKPFIRSAKPLTESLKEVLSKVVVPNVNTIKRKPLVSKQVKEPGVPKARLTPNQNVLKDVIMPPKAPDLANMKLPPSPSKSMERQAKPSKLNQQIATLMVPEIQTPEKGPSLLETVNAKTQGASTDLRVTGGIQEGNPYWGLVRRKVDQEWVAAPVEVHAGQPIQVVIGFRLQRTGHVQGITVEQSSGRSFFDLAAKRAVLAADPLPPFQADMKEAYYDLQFQFTVRKETP